jgi:RNA-directed DNA polymerase
MKIQLAHKFSDIVGVDNLLAAWQEFLMGKRSRKDVQDFSLHLMDNIFNLQQELVNHTYKHGPYQAFNICDPKPRNIHKATVRDRLLHHAIYRILYPYFDRKFIGDSYSCRLNKGTHKAIQRFKQFGRQASQNHTKTGWALKGDVRKFFASIDHDILLRILAKHIPDRDILWLVGQVVNSFYSTKPGKGLPLGNLTSQLLVNIYLNEFDQFVKHRLKVKHYIRYADDFAVFSQDKNWLENILLQMQAFLAEKLKLELHPDKVFIKTLASGVDFLGWVHFSDHRVLRTAAKRRMMRNLAEMGNKPETVQSYLGMLLWGNGHRLKKSLEKLIN